MKKLRIITWGLFLIFLFSCNDKLIDPVEFDREKLYATLFLHLFDNNFSGYYRASYKSDHIKSIFVELFMRHDAHYRTYGNYDPSERLITMLNEFTPIPVKFGSGCEISSEHVIDKKTYLRGILFRAGQIEKISEEEFIVYAGWFLKPLDGGMFKYTIIKKGGKYYVKESKLVMIS